MVEPDYSRSSANHILRTHTLPGHRLSLRFTVNAYEHSVDTKLAMVNGADSIGAAV